MKGATPLVSHDASGVGWNTAFVQLRSVHISFDSIAWSNGVDIEPEEKVLIKKLSEYSKVQIGFYIE